MSQRHAIADIKAMLQSRHRDLIARLVPDGAWCGLTYSARSPVRDDKKRGSFVVWAKAGAVGAWTDYATGEKGDIIGLIQHCERLADTRAALQWAEDWLGLARIPHDQIARARANAARDEAKAHADAAALAEKQRSQAFSWWLKFQPDLRGTVAETYLASRGIRLSELKRAPGALRFARSLDHKPSKRSFPAIVSLMTDSGTGKPAAVHRTYLAADGSGKADVDPPRMMWPSVKGSAIRIWRGETDVSPEEAARLGLIDTLAICEGVEDGLSLALACPWLRVWAAGSLPNLQSLTVPACAGEIVVIADNDWGKPGAEKLLRAGIAALVRQGVKVRVARSPIGKDVNDALRGAA